MLAKCQAPHKGLWGWLVWLAGLEGERRKSKGGGRRWLHDVITCLISPAVPRPQGLAAGAAIISGDNNNNNS